MAKLCFIEYCVIYLGCKLAGWPGQQAAHSCYTIDSSIWIFDFQLRKHFWEGLICVSLFEKVYHWELNWKCSSPMSFPIVSPVSPLSLSVLSFWNRCKHSPIVPILFLSVC